MSRPGELQFTLNQNIPLFDSICSNQDQHEFLLKLFFLLDFKDFWNKYTEFYREATKTYVNRMIYCGLEIMFQFRKFQLENELWGSEYLISNDFAGLGESTTNLLFRDPLHSL